MTSSPTFHFFLPQMRMTHDAIVERARIAEAVGFEGMAFMDHVVPPLAPDQPMWEAMSIAGWVLAHTTTLSVGHLVLCDSLRHPAMLAEQAKSLDHASGGRFELGIGSGFDPGRARDVRRQHGRRRPNAPLDWARRWRSCAGCGAANRSTSRASTSP